MPWARVQLPPKLQGEEGEAAWQKAVTASDALITIDLCCGARGLSYGFQEAGFVNAVGIDAIPQKSPCRPKLLEFGNLGTCSQVPILHVLTLLAKVSQVETL